MTAHNADEAEPQEGARVLASIKDACPDLVVWERRLDLWVDEHGCRRPWTDLADVVLLPPVKNPIPKGDPMTDHETPLNADKATLVDDLRSRLACIAEVTYWDRPYDQRIAAIRGMCDLTTNGMTPGADVVETLNETIARIEAVTPREHIRHPNERHTYWQGVRDALAVVRGQRNILRSELSKEGDRG